jgi:hypothetical protein
MKGRWEWYGGPQYNCKVKVVVVFCSKKKSPWDHFTVWVENSKSSHSGKEGVGMTQARIRQATNMPFVEDVIPVGHYFQS